MFVCPRCNYNTDHRYNLNTHFKRKNVCPNMNNIELNDDIKQNALYNIRQNPIEIIGSHNTTTQNNTNTSESYNTIDSHDIINNNNNNTTINLNVFNFASDFPILLKYQNLYDHFCKDMPTKLSIQEKKKKMFSKAIRELDKIKLNECLDKSPNEINIQSVRSMLRCLLDIPKGKKSDPKDFLDNTIVLYDEKKDQKYIYGTSTMYMSKKKSWFNENEICIISQIVPTILAIERNTLKMVYAARTSLINKNDKSDNVDKVNKVNQTEKRLQRLYKIIVCLDIDPIISRIDDTSFVNEVLDIDEDEDEYISVLDNLKKTNLFNMCKELYNDIKIEVKTDEDDSYSDTIKVLNNEIQRISETMSKLVKDTFVKECTTNPDFLTKMKDVDESFNESNIDVPEEFNFDYPK